MKTAKENTKIYQKGHSHWHACWSVYSHNENLPAYNTIEWGDLKFDDLDKNGFKVDEMGGNIDLAKLKWMDTAGGKAGTWLKTCSWF